MIWIATGITRDYYPRAKEYIESMAKHELSRSVVFTVDHEPAHDYPVRTAPVDYSKCLKQPKWMLQSGGFTVFAPNTWDECDVVVFTDADAKLQRPLYGAEIDILIRGTRGGGVMIGRNRPDGTQTLAEESLCLFPEFDPDEIERRFPTQREFSCRNTGCVAATLGTWKRLYADYQTIWPKVDASWGHYAKVQWGINYVVQKFPGYRLEDLPLSFHAHGHLGLPPGVHNDNGTWKHESETVFFAHAL